MEETDDAAPVLSSVPATPLMTQEPGMIGFNHPNSHYLTGGYGVRTPYNTGHYPRMPYGGYVAVEPAPVGVVVGVRPVGVAVGGPYAAYAYDPY